MARVEIEFPTGMVKADVTKNGLIAVHRSFRTGTNAGFIATHVPTMKCILWRRLKRDAVEAQKTLEDLDWYQF